MLRLFGAICVMAATVGAFGEVRTAMHRRTVELWAWVGAVRLLQSEMSFGLTPLPRICRLISQQVGGVVGDFWAFMADELPQRTDAYLPLLWAENMARCRRYWHLQADDLGVLDELGAGLGGSGLHNQQRLLALTEERLTRLADNSAAEYARLSRLLTGLGWCCGLILICLWV